MRLSDSKHAKVFHDKFPVITSQVDGWEELNPKLEQAIRSVGDKYQHTTNVKADMTDFRMWENDQPGSSYFQQVCAHAIKLSLANAPEQAKQHFAPVVSECWGAIYRKNEFAILHDHWPATWSFTYYVNVTDSCSPILFPDAKYSLKPKNGLMVMFPGWIAHKVPRQKSDHERVMVAGNIVQKL